MVLSAAAEVLLLAAAAITLGSHRKVWAVAMLAVAWPVYYAIVYGISFGMATIDQRGPAMANFPDWYQSLYPKVFRDLTDALYPRMASVALLVFPAIAIVMSVVVLWATATGRVHP